MLLRQEMDASGFNKTKIVAADQGPDGSDKICKSLAESPEFAKAVDVVFIFCGFRDNLRS